MPIRTGSIVSHVARKSAVYLAIKEPTGFYLVRVKKQVGYPIVPEGRYIEPNESRMTEVAFAPQYQTMTREQAARSNFRGGSRPQRSLDPCTDLSKIPADMLVQFQNLASCLSPENLSCDGELSRSAILVKFQQLTREWIRLEDQLGMSVGEDLIWSAYATESV